MKVYKVTKNSDCYAVSLVNEGAIESDFIYLNKQSLIQLNEEKRLVVGAVLIPDKLIYRCMNGQEFYISFSKEVIEELAQNFLINPHQITADHQEEINDVYVVESWIKNSNEDKSTALGLNEPIGTWFISLKIFNDEIWQHIKSGHYKGFSIEAFVDLEEIINNNVKLSMDQEFIDKLKEIIKECINPVEEEVKEEVVLEDATETPSEEPTNSLEEENKKLKEDIANLVAEVERLKAERDELESKLNDLKIEKDKADEELVKMSKQPSINPVKSVNNGLNYSAAIKFITSK